MFTEKWNEWVLKYGIENVNFVVGSIANMKNIKARFNFHDMVESYEDALKQTK